MEDSIFGKLDDLFAFCVLVEEGSLIKASARLGIPASTLSRRLTSLEERFGVKLAEIRNRRLCATALGRSLYQKTAASMARLDASAAAFADKQGQLAGRLRIMTHRMFWEDILEETVLRFLAAHPQTDIEVICNQMIDTVDMDANADLLVTCDLTGLQNCIAVPILNTVMGLFAGPGFFARHPRPERPEDIQTLPWISNYRSRQLKLCSRSGELATMTLDLRLVINDLLKMGELIEKGLFAGALPLDLLARFPKLERFLPAWTVDLHKVYLVYRERTLHPKLLSAFVREVLADAKRFYARCNSAMFDINAGVPAEKKG